MKVLDKIETPVTSFVTYTAINENIINLIDRVVNAIIPKLLSQIIILIMYY
jgi:hypothetical protein